MNVHYLSQVPIKLQLRFNNTELAVGTGFFYKNKDQLYLVSNWHNFSGRDPETLQPLAKHGGIPNKVKCRLILDGNFLAWDDHEFDLWDENDLPLWYYHPLNGHNIDVAALPISLPKKFKEIYINKYEFSEINVEVAQDVFVLGYPLGMNGRKELPIWKRGSIASEPGGNYPKILIDTATRKGMSGSPVIMRFRGIYSPASGPNILTDDTWVGEGDLFLGVYSGRLGTDEFLAQLGVVWKTKVIDEIIEGRESPPTI